MTEYAQLHFANKDTKTKSKFYPYYAMIRDDEKKNKLLVSVRTKRLQNKYKLRTNSTALLSYLQNTSNHHNHIIRL